MKVSLVACYNITVNFISFDRVLIGINRDYIVLQLDNLINLQLKGK